MVMPTIVKKISCIQLDCISKVCGMDCFSNRMLKTFILCSIVMTRWWARIIFPKRPLVIVG